MRNARHPRLLAPAVMIIYGAGITAAVVVAHGWESGIPIALIAAGGPILYYVWGRRDSDIGAMIGSRADERQNLGRMQARSLAAQAVAVAILVSTVVAVALKYPIWPLAIFAVVETVSFAAGLAIYHARGAR